MRKNKKQDNNQEGPQGVFYSQKLCAICRKLIVGRSPKSYQGANSDLGQRLKNHREEHEKEGNQLNLSLPGKEEKQTGSISRVTLRGEKTSV